MPKAQNPRREDSGLLMWPGIKRGFDARCSCTWAAKDEVYQVKARDMGCLNHGGPLDAVLARMARWGIRGGD